MELYNGGNYKDSISIALKNILKIVEQ